MRILVIGSLSFDFLGVAEDPLRGDTLTVALHNLVRGYGGRGANFAVYARALGCDVRLVAAVGDDFKASSYRTHLEERGIDIRGVFWNQSLQTQHVFVFTSGDDTRLYVFRDRRKESEESFQDWVVQQIGSNLHDAIYCTSETPMVNARALQESTSRVKVFAPGPDIHRYDLQCLQSSLGSANVVLVNSAEMYVIESLVGKDVISRFPNLRAVIVTYGSNGSGVHSAAGSFHVASLRTDRVVDATGAGDAYAAGFVTELAAKDDLLEAARIGSVVASFAIESVGCQTTVPDREAVLSRRVEFDDH